MKVKLCVSGSIFEMSQMTTRGSSQVLEFLVKNDSGEFFLFTALGKTAEFISKTFSTGSSVDVDFDIKTNPWTKDDGTTKYIPGLLAFNVRKTWDGNQSKPNQGPTQSIQPNQNFDKGVDKNDIDDDDTLPF